MKLLKKIFILLLASLSVIETFSANLTKAEAQDMPYFIVSDWQETGKKTYVVNGYCDGEGYYSYEKVRTLGYYQTTGWVQYSGWYNAGTVAENEANTNKYNGDKLIETRIDRERKLTKYEVATTQKVTKITTIFYTKYIKKVPNYIYIRGRRYQMGYKTTYETKSGTDGYPGARSGWTIISRYKTYSYSTAYKTTYSYTDYLESKPNDTSTKKFTEYDTLRQVQISKRVFNYKEKKEYGENKKSTYLPIDFSNGKVLSVTYTQTSGTNSGSNCTYFYFNKKAIYQDLKEIVENDIEKTTADYIKKYVGGLVDVATMTTKAGKAVCEAVPAVFEEQFGSGIGGFMSDALLKKLDVINGKIVIDGASFTTEQLAMASRHIKNFVTVAEIYNTLLEDGFTETTIGMITEGIIEIAVREAKYFVKDKSFKQLCLIATILNTVYGSINDFNVQQILNADSTIGDDELIRLEFFESVTWNGAIRMSAPYRVKVKTQESYTFNTVHRGYAEIDIGTIGSYQYENDLSGIEEMYIAAKISTEVFSLGDFVSDAVKLFTKI